MSRKTEEKKALTDGVIDSALQEINRKYGAKTAFVLGDEKPIEVETWPTNSISLDYVIGCGGMPRGRIIEVYGASSGGKTSMSLYLIAQVQKSGGRAAFIDVEQTFTSSYAEGMGVDTKTLIVSQPKSGDEALDIADSLIKTGIVDLVVVDSVASLVPQAELDGSVTDTTVALQARMMSKAMRYLTGSIAKSKTTLLFVNQVRDNIQTYGGFGPKSTTPGGNALKFYSSVRLEVKTVEKIKSGTETVGGIIQVTAFKNKIASPYRTARMTLMFGKGIARSKEILDWGLKSGVLTKSGITYFRGEAKLGAGEDKACEFLEANPDVMEAVDGEVRAKVFLAPTAGKG